MTRNTNSKMVQNAHRPSAVTPEITLTASADGRPEKSEASSYLNKPEANLLQSPLVRRGWERQAVARLCEVLPHSTMERLLGSLLQTARQMRKTETGVDRRGTKAELATALVVQHGVDLFCNPDIRKAVGKALKVHAPYRWHPGKPAAVDFVAAISFPGELAGLPSGDGFPDYEFLEGRFQLKPLLEFQREVKQGLDRILREPGLRAIVALPTGAGKTRVAVESIRDWMASRYDLTTSSSRHSTVLWLAHTEELCEQAYACFKQVWQASQNISPVLLVRFWGRYTHGQAQHQGTLRQIPSRPAVLISTPQRMINLLDGRIKGHEVVLKELRHSVGFLLIDEAHRAAAPTYRRIIKGILPKRRSVSVAGLTATPFRMEYAGNDPEKGTWELKEIFGQLIEPSGTLGDSPIAQLQEMGVLAKIIVKTIPTPITTRITAPVSGNYLSDDDAERIDHSLAMQTDNIQRRSAILKRLLPIARKKYHSILYFGPSVQDAECMAYLLRCEGIPAAVVSGRTREATRRQVVDEFKQNKIRVLCNCEVLSTGFDAPRVTHVVVARPTVSQVLYEQIVGRGLRGPSFGGTDTCVILDCDDHFNGNGIELGYEKFRRVWHR